MPTLSTDESAATAVNIFKRENSQDEPSEVYLRPIVAVPT